MSDVFTVCGIGLCAMFAASVIREIHGSYVKWIVLVFLVLCLGFLVSGIEEAVNFMNEVTRRTSTNYTGTILRALGITYLTSTASEICNSAGETSIGGYIEAIGKIEILIISLPLFYELLDMVLI